MSHQSSGRGIILDFTAHVRVQLAAVVDDVARGRHHHVVARARRHVGRDLVRQVVPNWGATLIGGQGGHPFLSYYSRSQSRPPGFPVACRALPPIKSGANEAGSSAVGCSGGGILIDQSGMITSLAMLNVTRTAGERPAREHPLTRDHAVRCAMYYAPRASERPLAGHFTCAAPRPWD
jgi:hypothetical protein